MDDHTNAGEREAEAAGRTIIADAFATHAMLVSFHSTTFPLTVTDRRASAAAAEAGNAERGSVRAQKNRLYGADEFHKGVIAQINAAYAMHRGMTLSWFDGARLLPNARWQDYTRKLGEHSALVRQAVTDFRDSYDECVARARAALGDWADEDYPSADEAARRFTMRVDFFPVPEPSAFTGLPPRVAQELGRRYESRMVEQAQAAMDEAVTRVREVVEPLVRSLEDENARLRVSTLENVKAQVPLLRALAFTGDPRFGELADAIDERIRHWTQAGAKASRVKAAGDARAVLDKLDAWGF